MLAIYRRSALRRSRFLSPFFRRLECLYSSFDAIDRGKLPRTTGESRRSKLGAFGQLAGGKLVDEPSHMPAAVAKDLGGPLIRMIRSVQHIAQRRSLVTAGNEKENLSRVTEHTCGKRDAVRVQLLNPVGHH